MEDRGPSAGDPLPSQSRGDLRKRWALKHMVPRAPLSCPHLGRDVACCPASPRWLREQRLEMKGAPPLSCSADPEGTQSQPSGPHFPLWPPAASAPSPSPLHKAVQPTCQRLRARRNFSCLVLMKWASSAGTDFWGHPGERSSLGVWGAPGASCSPGRPPLLLASLSLPASQASPHPAYSPGTRGGRGTWQRWAEPWAGEGRSRSGQEVSWPLRQARDLRCAYSPHGLLQSSLDKVLGILTEVGSHGATPGHPPFQDIQKRCSVTLSSKWG